ncbi:bifunctional 2-polyprenyl-6-hydroxyphenol methylase/3-demethylubiquinol 3-O-methyltransferase UbiG [Cellulomonas sp. URHD0024]|uniref:class I SAM-dependent methyltransferase n=1 Tax=Cellulomonas sp. URHD0024 TaxID=1302620 RepID=UPI000406637B|nr:class I SAM-dependent methyltransferase [Cellulomonas sp. URHD0024]
MPRDPFWNHNTHYHPLALKHVRGSASALDVGCGEGLLVRRLRAAGVTSVTGIDLDPHQVGRAVGGPGIDYLAGDILDVPGGEFDLVTCFATLHHLDLEAGLIRLAALTAPGGHLVVVGLAAVRSAVDAAASLAAVPVALVADRVRGTWEHGSPMVDPVDGYGDVRRAARAILPGVRFRRRLYWRYSLEWQHPL